MGKIAFEHKQIVIGNAGKRCTRNQYRIFVVLEDNKDGFNVTQDRISWLTGISQPDVCKNLKLMVENNILKYMGRDSGNRNIYEPHESLYVKELTFNEWKKLYGKETSSDDEYGDTSISDAKSEYGGTSIPEYGDTSILKTVEYGDTSISDDTKTSIPVYGAASIPEYGDTSIKEYGDTSIAYQKNQNITRMNRSVSEFKFGVGEEFFELLYKHLMSTKTWITTAKEVTVNYFLINDTHFSLKDFSTKLHIPVSMRFKPDDPNPDYVTYGVNYNRVFDAVYEAYSAQFIANAKIKIEQESFREIPLIKAELRKVLRDNGYSDTEVQHIMTHPNISPDEEDKDHAYKNAMLKYFRQKLSEYDTHTLINMEIK